MSCSISRVILCGCVHPMQGDRDIIHTWESILRSLVVYRLVHPPVTNHGKSPGLSVRGRAGFDSPPERPFFGCLSPCTFFHRLISATRSIYFRPTFLQTLRDVSLGSYHEIEAEAPLTKRSQRVIELKKGYQLAHGEGRTRSLQIARES